MTQPSREDPSQAEIMAALQYIPETGVFLWRHPGGRKFPHAAGAVAGSIRLCNGRPCLMITVGKKQKRAHRLAWIYVYGTGSAPEIIDHRDINPLNNSIDNLRAATNAQNMANAKRPRHNTSGYKGVCWCVREKKWRAGLVVAQKWIFLGQFDDPREAHAAYMRKAVEVYGEFARSE